MYIYWSDKIVVTGASGRAQGLIIAPEKEGKDPFQPAVSGDTVTVILPRVSEGPAAVEKMQIVLEEANDSLPLLNPDSYLFAYEGRVYGRISGVSGDRELNGIIFKAVKSVSECTPETKLSEVVLVITDFIGEEIDIPEILRVTVTEKPEEEPDDESGSETVG